MALHDGAFVWGDSTDDDVESGAANEFTARASGGVRFFSSADLSTGVTLAAGDGSWANVCDRNAKRGFLLEYGLRSALMHRLINTFNNRESEIPLWRKP
jgi:hypothetical protein